MLCVTASFAKFVFDLRAVEKIASSWRVWSLYVMNGLYSTLMAQFSQQDGLFLFFVQAVVVFQACVLEKLGNHIGAFARVLAQVERHSCGAEHGHGTDEVCQNGLLAQAGCRCR